MVWSGEEVFFALPLSLLAFALRNTRGWGRLFPGKEDCILPTSTRGLSFFLSLSLSLHCFFLG